jgi:hypothetical protein
MNNLPTRRTQKRDEQLRRFVRRLRTIAPHVDHPEYAPLLRAFAMVSLMLERCYSKLRDRDLISEKTNEIRSSVETVQRLAGQAAKLAASLNLTPAVMGKMKNRKTVDLAGAIADAEVISDG